MRTWRVGTFSMGLSLLFLGIFLLLSQFLQWDITTVLKVWWPVILVVLGVEILLYLFTSKQEKPYLNFDLFSIIIVGIIGTAGIAIVFLQSTGLITAMQEEFNREEVTMDLPSYDYKIKNNIKRVVIDTEGQSSPLSIEGTDDNTVSLFGTYRSVNADKKVMIKKAQDYVLVNEKGDTVYVNLKDLPIQSRGFSSSYSTIQSTILIPNNIKVEIVGENDELTVNPRNLRTDWSISNASSLNLNLADTENVQVKVKDTEILDSESEKWKSENKDEADENEPNILAEASYVKGKKNATINIVNSGSLEVTTE
ncbi:LiaI-LiaF-like domain-containing protein [Niallia sp. 01092]|uniref:LiaI-LiaF-like domain-containing protein n=1 Tax=unclassified Niallia TaxID=2837522 RepID=UPI003FD28F60